MRAAVIVPYVTPTSQLPEMGEDVARVEAQCSLACQDDLEQEKKKRPRCAYHSPSLEDGGLTLNFTPVWLKLLVNTVKFLYPISKYALPQAPSASPLPGHPGPSQAPQDLPTVQQSKG